jgi:hypothetical protein
VLASRADLASLGDADAATALNRPNPLVLRPGSVTITTLAGSDVWGFAKATAALAAFQTVASAGGANGATAAALIAVLTGPGFLTSDPQVAMLGLTFVGLSGGVLVDADVTTAIYLPPTYPCGTPDVTTQQVTTARGAIAFTAQKQTLFQAGALVWNAWANAVESATSAGQLPGAATLPGEGD